MANEQTLSEALALLGITHEPHACEGMRIWTAPTGELIGVFDAHEGWKKLRELTAVVDAERGVDWATGTAVSLTDSELSDADYASLVGL